jgi:Tfp pilus assembly protein PilO
MSMTRRWSLLTAVLIVGIMAASWFLLVSPKRSTASELRGKATAQQVTNDGLVQQLNELKAQSLDLPKQKAQLAVLHKQIPDNPALPTLIRDLTAAGNKVGVQVVSMKPSTPVASTVTAAVPVAGAATAAASTAAPLYLLPLQLEITGSYFELEQFINKLEGMQRTFLLTAFDLKLGGTAAPAPGATASSSTATATATDELTLNLTGSVFLSPNVASSTSAAAPVAAQAQ